MPPKAKPEPLLPTGAVAIEGEGAVKPAVGFVEGGALEGFVPVVIVAAIGLLVVLDGLLVVLDGLLVVELLVGFVVAVDAGGFQVAGEGAAPGAVVAVVARFLNERNERKETCVRAKKSKKALDRIGVGTYGYFLPSTRLRPIAVFFEN